MADFEGVFTAHQSMIFKYLLPQVTGGFAIIFSAIIAAVIGALVFPVAEEEKTEGEAQ